MVQSRLSVKITLNLEDLIVALLYIAVFRNIWNGPFLSFNGYERKFFQKNCAAIYPEMMKVESKQVRVSYF